MPRFRDQLPDFTPPTRGEWLALAAPGAESADMDDRLRCALDRDISITALADATVAPAAAQLPLPRPGGGWDIATGYDGLTGNSRLSALREDIAGGANAVCLPAEADLAALLRDIPLAAVRVLMAGGAPAQSFELLRVAAAAQHLEEAAIRADLGVDPLGRALASGGATEPVHDRGAEAAAVAAAIPQDLSGVTVMTASGHSAHEAGAGPVVELAWVLTAGAAYLRALEAAGVAPATAWPRIRLELAAGCGGFVEIAKFRALRALWPALVKACGGLVDRISLTGRMAQRDMARREPMNNILRATAAAWAAALGGADVILLNPHRPGDPADPAARRLARTVQLVLREESQLTRGEDPAAGSYSLEAMTDALARAAWVRFQAFEAAGGALAALEQGSIQAECKAAADARAAALAAGDAQIVGVTLYPDPGAEVTPPPAAATSVPGELSAAPARRAAAGFEAKPPEPLS